MTNAEFVERLSDRLGQSRAEIKRLIKAGNKTMRHMLDKDVGITIPGLGTFHTHLVQPRKSYDPYHKHYLLLPKKRVIQFHPSTSLKDDVKQTRIENE